MIRISGKCNVKKVADLGKPGSPNHAVELEVKMPRRDIMRLIVPFAIASMMLNKSE